MNDEMDDGDETQLADESNSVKNSSMNFNTEEQRDTQSNRVSNISSAEISKIVPPMLSSDEENKTNVSGHSIVDGKSAKLPPNPSNNNMTIESISDDIPINPLVTTIPTAVTNLDKALLATAIVVTTSTAPTAEVTTQPQSVMIKSNRDDNVVSIPPPRHQDNVNNTSTKQPVSVEGNDRVTLDQPPNVALVANSNTPSDPQIVVDLRATTSQPNPNAQEVAVVATDSKIDYVNLLTKSQPTDVVKTLSSIQPQPEATSDPKSATSTLSATVAVNALTPHAATLANRPTSTSISSEDRAPPTTQQTAQQVAEEEAIAAVRAPLVNLYGSYLCHSKDTSLADARKRLRNAITQTRSLRQTFTERVYGKYRVCLRPPPTADEIIAKIEADPVNQLRALKEEIAVVREEKEIEKKEAAKLNNEMSQSSSADRVPVLSNIDNAEQLMFLTAGLNLVILPEEQSEEQLRAYIDAYSQSSTTGRARNSISQAAASAGEVILDRTRKAAAMRVERQRRRQLQLLRGESLADGESENNYSRLQVLKVAGTSATKQTTSDSISKNQAPISNVAAAAKQSQPSSRRVPAASTKGGRSRSQSSLPTSTLLSINPSADEVKIDGNPSAATLALIARGVGQTMTKSTQQRLRHPHPDSLGGRRRANMNPGSMKKEDDTPMHPPEPFLQSNLANTLPPLPASKERLERKRVADEYLDTPATRKARHSVQSILINFVENTETNIPKPIPKINLLNSMRKQSLNLGDAKPSGDLSISTAPDASGSSDSSLNLALTMSVLYALGIVSRTQPCSSNDTSGNLPELNVKNKALCSDRLMSLKAKIIATSSTITQSIDRCDKELVPVEISRKRTRSSNNDTARKLEDHCSTTENSVDEEICKPESIDKVEMSQPDSATTISTSATTPGIDSVRPKKRQRASSSPTRPSNTGPQIASDQYLPQQVAATAPINFSGNASIGPAQTHFAQSNAMNMFQFANQLSHMHHPAAGDLAEYLGSFQQHQHGYDLPQVLAGTVATPLSMFGLMQPFPTFPGYTIQDRAANARAMIVREQHAAALLGGYQLSPPSHFSQLQGNPFAVGQNVPSLIGQTEVQTHQTNTNYPILGPVETTDNATPTENSGISVTQAPCTETDASIKAQSDEDGGTELVPNEKPSASTGVGGLQFVAPISPSSLPSKYKDCILGGVFHEVAEEAGLSDCETAIEYLLSVGSAIPIPKALVLAPLKDRLNTPGFKNVSGNSTPLVTRDVVAAAILVWLWVTQEQTFQKAFRCNGRIDVDTDCKWLIQAAVDTAVSELSLEIAESVAKGEGKFAEASALRKAIGASSIGPSNPEILEAAKKLDACTAAVVTKALSTEMCISAEMNFVVPASSLLVDFLDEARLGALRVKSQERTLLANLIARNTYLSENLAHAYVSAMVRAGEAVKHGRLFEIAQDETAMTSTMIPYDIFTDETGAWEDPCKPDDGFTVGLSGEELARRAHARAMIQKSLRKLQDRHHIRGGTTIYGPFVDPAADPSRPHTGSATKERPSLLPQRSGLKRRVSSMIEPPIVPGTGSASAKNWGVYHPRRVSVPLEWDPEDVGNLPYGMNPRSRFLPLSNRRNDQDPSIIPNDSVARYLHRSTSEINWVDVASTFQSVEVPRKPYRYKVIEHETHVTIDGTIFAPFYKEINDDFSSDDDDDSNDVEDLSDATVVARHQVVLDSMKAKLEAYLEARKKQQERRKNKYAK